MDPGCGDGPDRRWPSGLQDHDGARDQLVVRQRNVETFRSHSSCLTQSFAMQVEFGFSGGQPFDFDVLPRHSSGPAGSKSLEAGLLRGETCGEVNLRIRAFLAVENLTFCIYST